MQHEISGFWRRVIAFFIDGLILGGVGLLLGMFLSEQFVLLGGLGRGVGFVIAALYFGILNSSIANGQTLGKRLLGIQVITRDGQLLNIAKSFLRYSIIAVPYFLNGAHISSNSMQTLWIYVLALLVFGFGLSIIYLILFNRNTRQSLHDLLVGTYVIRIKSETEISQKTVWRIHYGVCGILLISSLFIPTVVKHLSQTGFFSELLETQKQIQNLSSVVHASVNDGKSTFKPAGGDATVTTYITSQVFLSKNETDNKSFATEIANIVLATHKTANQRDIISIVLTYGYDIGIASFWQSNRYGYTPEEWLKENKK